MLTYLRRLVDERTSLTEIATRMADTAATENRDLNESERAEMVRMETRCAELDGQISQHNGQVESARAYATLVERIEQNSAAPTNTNGRIPEQRGPNGRVVETTAPAQAFVESAEFRSYVGHGTSGRVGLDNYLEFRAPITTANLAIPHYVSTPVEQTFTPVLAPLVNVVRVSSGVVDWVVIGADPTAAVVAEGSAKPEAAATFTPATSSLDTIAHWYQITRQALDDASYIRSLLEGKLRRGLLKKVDADLLAAIAAAAVSGGVDADLSKAIRKGIGYVEGNGYTPNGIIINPSDYVNIDVAAAALPGGTPVTRTRTYWGLPVVPHASVAAGTAYVGEFDEAVTLFDRGVTDVFMSDSHASLFISNILVILAEARVKSAVTEPAGMCKVTTA